MKQHGRRLSQGVCIASLLGLMALCLTWEGVLAPLRPGGSWLILKALPLLLPLRGILYGRVYTFQWASMLILIYFTEGIVRAWGDGGLSAQLALLEVVLSSLFFSAAIGFIRSRGQRADA
ncbi:MAG: DUF2069 domain-containing protein [Betaproteobacteria bacterium]|nr:DUF2069 domain-containing protein [Betaproteobacteria bacterium]